MAETNLPRVPEGLRDMLKAYTREVLSEKPNNLYEFSLRYFEKIGAEVTHQTVDKFEAPQSYEIIMKNRIRQQVPISLAFSIIPESLTDVMKKFIKAVLKEKPENLLNFAIEYFKKVNYTSAQVMYTKYAAYEKYIEGNRSMSSQSNLTCACGRLLSSKEMTTQVQDPSSVTPQVLESVENNKYNRYLQSVCIIQKHFRRYLKRIKQNPTKSTSVASRTYNSQEYINAIFIIQRQFRRFLSKRRAKNKTEFKSTQLQDYNSLQYMKAVLVIQRYSRNYLKKKLTQQTLKKQSAAASDSNVSLMNAAFIIQRAFRRMIRMRKAKRHTNAEIDICDETNDNASEAASYTSASTALLSTESAGDHNEFGATIYEEGVHQQTIKEDEEVENENNNHQKEYITEAIKKSEKSIYANGNDINTDKTEDERGKCEPVNTMRTKKFSANDTSESVEAKNDNSYSNDKSTLINEVLIQPGKSYILAHDSENTKETPNIGASSIETSVSISQSKEDSSSQVRGESFNQQISSQEEENSLKSKDILGFEQHIAPSTLINTDYKMSFSGKQNESLVSQISGSTGSNTNIVDQNLSISTASATAETLISEISYINTNEDLSKRLIEPDGDKCGKCEPENTMDPKKHTNPKYDSSLNNGKATPNIEILMQPDDNENTKDYLKKSASYIESSDSLSNSEKHSSSPEPAENSNQQKISQTDTNYSDSEQQIRPTTLINTDEKELELAGNQNESLKTPTSGAKQTNNDIEDQIISPKISDISTDAPLNKSQLDTYGSTREKCKPENSVDPKELTADVETLENIQTSSDSDKTTLNNEILIQPKENYTIEHNNENTKQNLKKIASLSELKTNSSFPEPSENINQQNSSLEEKNSITSTNFSESDQDILKSPSTSAEYKVSLSCIQTDSLETEISSATNTNTDIVNQNLHRTSSKSNEQLTILDKSESHEDENGQVVKYTAADKTANENSLNNDKIVPINEVLLQPDNTGSTKENVIKNVSLLEASVSLSGSKKNSSLLEPAENINQQSSSVEQIKHPTNTNFSEPEQPIGSSTLIKIDSNVPFIGNRNELLVTSTSGATQTNSDIEDQLTNTKIYESPSLSTNMNNPESIKSLEEEDSKKMGANLTGSEVFEKLSNVIGTPIKIQSLLSTDENSKSSNLSDDILGTQSNIENEKESAENNTNGQDITIPKAHTNKVLNEDEIQFEPDDENVVPIVNSSQTYAKNNSGDDILIMKKQLNGIDTDNSIVESEESTKIKHLDNPTPEISTALYKSIEPSIELHKTNTEYDNNSFNKEEEAVNKDIKKSCSLNSAHRSDELSFKDGSKNSNLFTGDKNLKAELPTLQRTKSFNDSDVYVNPDINLKEKPITIIDTVKARNESKILSNMNENKDDNNSLPNKTNEKDIDYFKVDIEDAISTEHTVKIATIEINKNDSSNKIRSESDDNRLLKNTEYIMSASEDENTNQQISVLNPYERPVIEYNKDEIPIENNDPVALDAPMSPIKKNNQQIDNVDLLPLSTISEDVKKGSVHRENKSSLLLSNQSIGSQIDLSSTNNTKKLPIVKDKQLTDSSSNRLLNAPIAELQLKSFKTSSQEGPWYEVFNEPNDLNKKIIEYQQTNVSPDKNSPEFGLIQQSPQHERAANYIYGDRFDTNDQLKQKQSVAFFISFDENDGKGKYKVSKIFFKKTDAEKHEQKTSEKNNKKKAAQGERELNQSVIDLKLRDIDSLKLHTIHEQNENELSSEPRNEMDNSEFIDSTKIQLEEPIKNNLLEAAIIFPDSNLYKTATIVPEKYLMEPASIVPENILLKTANIVPEINQMAQNSTTFDKDEPVKSNILEAEIIVSESNLLKTEQIKNNLLKAPIIVPESNMLEEEIIVPETKQVDQYSIISNLEEPIESHLLESSIKVPESNLLETEILVPECNLVETVLIDPENYFLETAINVPERKQVDQNTTISNLGEPLKGHLLESAEIVLDRNLLETEKLASEKKQMSQNSTISDNEQLIKSNLLETAIIFTENNSLESSTIVPETKQVDQNLTISNLEEPIESHLLESAINVPEIISLRTEIFDPELNLVENASIDPENHLLETAINFPETKQEFQYSAISYLEEPIKSHLLESAKNVSEISLLEGAIIFPEPKGMVQNSTISNKEEPIKSNLSDTTIIVPEINLLKTELVAPESKQMAQNSTGSNIEEPIETNLLEAVKIVPESNLLETAITVQETKQMDLNLTTSDRGDLSQIDKNESDKFRRPTVSVDTDSLNRMKSVQKHDESKTVKESNNGARSDFTADKMLSHPKTQLTEIEAANIIQKSFRKFLAKQLQKITETESSTRAKILAAIRIQNTFRSYIRQKKIAKPEWFVGSQRILLKASDPEVIGIPAATTVGSFSESNGYIYIEPCTLDAQKDDKKLAYDIVNELYSTEDNGAYGNLAGAPNRVELDFVKDFRAMSYAELDAALKDDIIRKITNEFLIKEIKYNSSHEPDSQVHDEVYEIPCVKRCISLTILDDEESNLNIQDKVDNNNTSQSDLDAVDSATLKLSRADEVIEKMTQRRASEIQEKSEKAVFHNTDAIFNEPSVRPISSLQEQISLDIEDTDIIIYKRLQRDETRESSAQSDSVIFGNDDEEQTLANDTDMPKAQLLRHYTIAGDDPHSIFNSMTIVETVKYIDDINKDSSTEPNRSSSFCLDDETSENIRKQILAYSLSEADSDYYDLNKIIKDDSVINTAMTDVMDTSTETESTIVSAAAKIQAGARGFLTRRRLRRASAGTKSSTQDTKASFGNDAISESLERLIEEEAAKKIQLAYRLHAKKSNKVTSINQSVSLEHSLAAKRQTLQRGDALQNDSNPTPEEENSDSTNAVQTHQMVETHLLKKKEERSNKKTDLRLNWHSLRQNSMPVQIDCEVLRVIPKHKRRRIRSAEDESKKLKKNALRFA